MNEITTIIRATCGTVNGYQSHKRYKEVACDGCKKAWNQYNADRLLKAGNREKANLATKKWQENNPEIRADYYERNKSKLYATRMARRTENKVKTQDQTYRYNAKNRAKKFNVLSTPYTIAEVLATYGAICHVCSDEIDLKAPRTARQSGWEKGLHIDHVIPLALGGTDTISNVKPSHAQCNLLKAQRVS